MQEVRPQQLPHPELTPELLKIKGASESYYDRPIAVLIGPGSVSAGDLHAQRLLVHPMVRTFGKPSNGGFTLNDNPDYGPRWWTSRAIGSAYTVDGNRFLAHTGVPVDFEVWLNADDVAVGRDTVVETAIAWIQRPLVRRLSGRRICDP
jgi:C-terminal processing protease CtpA/Prc